MDGKDFKIQERIEIVKNANGTETEIHRQDFVPVEEVALKEEEVAAKKDEENQDDGDETEDLSSEEELDEDEECYESEPIQFEGKTYQKMWDDDEKIWIVTEPLTHKMVGHPNEEGGINFIE